MQCITEKIKAERKAVKNRHAANEENIDTTLQFVAQFLVNATVAPGLVRINGQSAEFFAGIVAETVAVAHSLPCPLKVPQFFLRIIQILVADKLGKKPCAAIPKARKSIVGKLVGMEISINPLWDNFTFEVETSFSDRQNLRGIYAKKCSR